MISRLAVSRLPEGERQRGSLNLEEMAVTPSMKEQQSMDVGVGRKMGWLRGGQDEVRPSRQR